MTQIFIFGASSVYGVGSTEGSWADMVKRKVHGEIYSEGGVGERVDVYNFAKSGVTVEFVLENFEKYIADFRKKGKVVILVSIGGNNSRAMNTPENFVSTGTEYKELMEKLLRKMQTVADDVICVGFTWVDESKTTPIVNKLLNHSSYFYNHRFKEFNEICSNVCDSLFIPFIESGVDENEWKEKYLYVDGLHPNAEGQKLLFEKVWKTLMNYLQ